MKKIISFILTVTMMLTAVSVFAADASQKDYPQSFWDVPKNHWAFEYIAELTNRGVISGYEDGSYRPNNTVTRAEWAKIMVLAAGLTASDNSVYFKDMKNHWANEYVNTAKNYLAAYTDGTFKPDQAAVREDVTVSLVKLKGYDINSVDYSYLSQFTDTNSISNSLKAYVAVAIQNNLISGFEDNTFRGQDTLTRAEAATLLWKAFQSGSNNKVVDTPNTPVSNTTPTVTPEPTEKPKETNTNKEEQKNNNEQIEETAPTEQPTPEPEPEIEIKPYKVDTIVKADVENEYFYTKDEADNIYYVTGDKIYKVNITGKTPEEIFDVSDLIIDTEEMTLDDFHINSICYNENNDSLLLQGKYETVNSIDTPNNSYLYELKNGSANALTDNFDGYNNLVTVLENGDIAVDSQLYDGSTYEHIDQYIYHSGDTGYCPYTIIELGNELYFCGKANYGAGWIFCKYDYVDSKYLWVVDVDGDSWIGGEATGINKNKVFVSSFDEVYIYNYFGKLLKKIPFEDFEIKDKRNFATNRMLEKLLITQNENIIFYDSSAKAFRMISENE